MGTGYQPDKKIVGTDEYRVSAKKKFFGTDGYRVPARKKFWVPMGTEYKLEKIFIKFT